MRKFIPEGEHGSCTLPTMIVPSHCSGYYTNESEFLARVEEDATSFKPPGQLIYSYTRPSPIMNERGKGTADVQNLDPESLDAMVFEVYHVSVSLLSPGRLPTPIQGDMEYSWIQRISPENAAFHPLIY